MRVALVASVGAALLSASVALYVVMRDPEVGIRDAAAAMPDPSSASYDPSEAAGVSTEPEPSAPSMPEATPQAELETELESVAWPDMQLGALPPVGAAPETMGQSAGSPRDGALLRPMQLPPGRGYVIRNPQTAWGTRNTVERLRAAIEKVRRAHPELHQLVIGDISTRRGGPLAGHQSHQSGRDVDIGLWLRPQPESSGPSDFVEGNSKNLDRRATYDLIEALAASANEPDGVELIVLDYNLQRVLRRYAEQTRGVPEAKLEALFQFPHGPNSRHGLVRHMPAHRDHLHVRFRCPQGDAYCRDPLIGFGGMEAAEEPSTAPSGI